VGFARVDEKPEGRAVSWRARYSRRFHGLSHAGLNKLIASLLAAKFRRGKQAPLDVDAGTIQKLCAATRCLPQTEAAAVRTRVPFLQLAPEQLLQVRGKETRAAIIAKSATSVAAWAPCTACKDAPESVPPRRVRVEHGCVC